jgi:Ni,Fe-hydrogenase III small subunit/Pyruvate/2-oxoacid:ferredoxin oxidoreductase delta subunit
MFNVIKKIIKYPRLTQNYPKKQIDSSLYIGKPEINLEKCMYCGECQKRCPSQAIQINQETKTIGINLDECIFCGLCEEVCVVYAITMSTQFELAEKNRSDLRETPVIIDEQNIFDQSYPIIEAELKKNIKKIFGRSLQIREVDAGSCNGCDSEINALSNQLNDIERLGINFVASPRHADMLLVTGTGTRNMQRALIKTYNATPDPKLVVAVGACACSGGIFKDSYATSNGIDTIVPVDVYIPGCPPRPLSILYGILKAIDKV